MPGGSMNPTLALLAFWCSALAAAFFYAMLFI